MVCEVILPVVNSHRYFTTLASAQLYISTGSGQRENKCKQHQNRGSIMILADNSICSEAVLLISDNVHSFLLSLYWIFKFCVLLASPHFSKKPLSDFLGKNCKILSRIFNTMFHYSHSFKKKKLLEDLKELWKINQDDKHMVASSAGSFS